MEPFLPVRIDSLLFRFDSDRPDRIRIRLWLPRTDSTIVSRLSELILSRFWLQQTIWEQILAAWNRLRMDFGSLGMILPHPDPILALIEASWNWFLADSGCILGVPEPILESYCLIESILYWFQLFGPNSDRIQRELECPRLDSGQFLVDLNHFELIPAVRTRFWSEPGRSGCPGTHSG